MTDKDLEKQSIALRLRQAREYAGLSQNQVARLLNMHRPTISEIEAGRRKVSAGELNRFAHTYDVSVSWLVGEGIGASNDDATVELAARELSKLKKEDRETVIRLLRSLSGRGGKEK
jgi:transcriptional regulator with XRE-family HTH domain